MRYLWFYLSPYHLLCLLLHLGSFSSALCSLHSCSGSSTLNLGRAKQSIFAFGWQTRFFLCRNATLIHLGKIEPGNRPHRKVKANLIGIQSKCGCCHLTAQTAFTSQRCIKAKQLSIAGLRKKDREWISVFHTYVLLHQPFIHQNCPTLTNMRAVSFLSTNSFLKCETIPLINV